MSYKKIEVKKGIKIHEIKTNKFKTNLVSVFLTTKLDRNTVTKNALVAAVLRRGTKNMHSQDIISQNLEEMYGASFNCGIEKLGDNKGMYALERATEEMFKDKPFGLYKYGYIEDLEKIDAKNLYEYYKELILSSKIDIFVSGDIEDNVIDIIKNNEIILGLNERNIEVFVDNEKENIKEIKYIEDTLDITQGKLVIGLDVMEQDEELSYAAMLYNAILGGGANSKLFQNVREKNSLAYTCGSN